MVRNSDTRANLASEIRRYQPADVLISEDMTKLLDTVARFIERGGTLTIDAKPQPPIDIEGFKPLMKPGADLVRRLRVQRRRDFVPDDLLERPQLRLRELLRPRHP